MEGVGVEGEAPVSMFVVRCYGNSGGTPTDDVMPVSAGLRPSTRLDLFCFWVVECLIFLMIKKN